LIDEFGRPVKLLHSTDDDDDDDNDSAKKSFWHLRLLMVADQTMVDRYFDENLNLYIKTLLSEVASIFK
jgi:hypothetical protein